MNDMHDAGAAAFEAACRDLARIARLNAEAVLCCIELHADQPDEESGRMCIDSVGMGLKQLAHLLMPLQILALDLETAAARQVS